VGVRRLVLLLLFRVETFLFVNDAVNEEARELVIGVMCCGVLVDEMMCKQVWHTMVVSTELDEVSGPGAGTVGSVCIKRLC
jgi:hypothetical protein